MAKGDVRTRMVAGAVRLLAERGLEGTSFGDVLAATGASRGSVYHHFPGGKRELVDAALDVASLRAMEAMEAVRGEPAPVVMERFLSLWRHLLVATELRVGCAVLAVTVASDEPQLTAHTGRIFRAWREQLESLFVAGGAAADRARGLAALAIAATEGAVAVARAERDLEAFELVAAQLVAQAEDRRPD